MNPSTLDPMKSRPPEGVSTRRCLTCHGVGEVIARSRSVGSGCINDDWSECPDCHGVGRVLVEAPAPVVSDEATPAGRAVIRTALLDALRTAVFKVLEHGPGADAGRLETAKAALAAFGRTTPEEVERHIAAITAGWRDAQAPWAVDPAGLAPLEVESLR